MGPAEVQALLAVARGALPADVLLRNARLVNVFSGEVEETSVALAGGRIAGIGATYSAARVVELGGAFVAPGLIDAHVHIESSLTAPAGFAAEVLPRGVTTVVADPHEIANVAGVAGVRFMAEASHGLPLRVVLQCPSCVPASGLASAGAELTVAELEELISQGVVHGLGEMMSFPGVVHGAPDALAKLALFAGRARDGHAPGLGGAALNAYLAAGPGSDHECTTLGEAFEKLSRGMMIFAREASGASNLAALLPLVNARTERRICLCTDDRHPAKLVEEGGIDAMLRAAIATGLDPVTAFRLATLNPAEWFGLPDRGAVAPGRLADLIVFDRLECPVARQVWVAGELVAQDGEPVEEWRLASPATPRALRGSVRVRWEAVDLRVPARGAKVRVIVVVPGQVLTRQAVLEPSVVAGLVEPDHTRDLAKIAVIERHHATGRVGLGLVQGLTLSRGAVASTVAHDHHNLIVAGMDDASMLLAARRVAELGGGMVVAGGGSVLAELALPVGGLMSDRPLREVAASHRGLRDACQALGSTLDDPLMTLSFLGLEVIPELKLTDRGLVDVARFELVDLFV
jgi:adenine deaminase